MTNVVWIAEWTLLIAVLFAGVFSFCLALSLSLYKVGDWRRSRRGHTDPARPGIFGRHWGDL